MLECYLSYLEMSQNATLFYITVSLHKVLFDFHYEELEIVHLYISIYLFILIAKHCQILKSMP